MHDKVLQGSFWLDLGDKLKLTPTDDDTSATSILDINVGQIEGNGSKEQILYVIGRTTPLTRLLNISVSNICDRCCSGLY